MKVKLLDTQTGKTTESSGHSTFEWEENNWSCDCNRETLFGNDSGGNICIGCHRYVVVEASCETEDDHEATLAELNCGYPDALLVEAGIERRF